MARSKVLVVDEEANARSALVSIRVLGPRAPGH